MKYASVIIMAFALLLSPNSFAAKAVCVAKNTQTNQIYQAMVGKRSYSVAKKQSAQLVLTKCSKRSYKSQYCRLNGCYKP